jgi:hypothetical protein
MMFGSMYVEEGGDGFNRWCFVFGQKNPYLLCSMINDEKIAIVSIHTGYQMSILIFVGVLSATYETHVHVEPFPRPVAG